MATETMIMEGLDPTMLKSLAITPDGRCAKHPDVQLCEPVSAEATHLPALLECKACWKEQQERKHQSSSDLTMTTSVSITPSEIAAVVPPPPALLQAVPSGTTLPSGNSKLSEALKHQAEWSDAVMLRWNQVQEIGIVRSSSPKPSASTLGMDESGSSHTAVSMSLNGESWHARLNPSQSQHHPFNMSMAAVAEEPSGFSSKSPSFHTRGSSSAPSTPAPWKRLEEQVQRQEESIQQLRETVERQETSIRQDLQQLIQLVTNLAANNGAQQQQQQRSPKADDSATMSHNRDISVGVLETPIVSNKEMAKPNAEDMPPPPGETTPQRPSLYDKSDHHPANIFTSVRTIERKPPKPPMRHNSFSTAASRRQSNASNSHVAASIISSLGNSTVNNSTHNTSTATPGTIDNNTTEDEDLEMAADYGPGVESMLERSRSQPLEIIFDASGRINSDFLFSKEEEQELNDNGEDNEEKKSGSSTGTPEEKAAPSPPPLRSVVSTGSVMSKRDSFMKSPGKIRLKIPDDELQKFDDEEDDEHDIAVNQLALPKALNMRSRSESPNIHRTTSVPQRIKRKVTPPFQSNSRISSRPARKPQRELSVADMTTERAANRRHSTGRPDVYVPPQQPPAAGTNPSKNYNTQQSNLSRLHPSNLSKLGASTAPPRREIFASGGSKLQISCLTIDTALISSGDGEGNGSGVKYGEVANMSVTDKFGDKGNYTGTLREEEMENEDKTPGAPKKRVVGIPHGTGTMKYEGGRFYKGEWRDGHWHGHGLLRNANGDSYEGDFVYDARHGHGIYKYENGDVYEGDFTEDKRHGKGTFMFQNGSVYRGDFVNGDFEGYGWYEFDDGYYEGEWKNGAYHGIGTLQYTDGGSYTGRFYEGKAHGHGEEKDADGTIRRGVWDKGELSGSQ